MAENVLYQRTLEMKKSLRFSLVSNKIKQAQIKQETALTTKTETNSTDDCNKKLMANVHYLRINLLADAFRSMFSWSCCIVSYKTGMVIMCSETGFSCLCTIVIALWLRFFLFRTRGNISNVDWSKIECWAQRKNETGNVSLSERRNLSEINISQDISTSVVSLDSLLSNFPILL